MFSAEEYFFGWFIYLLAVIGLLTVFWRITRNIISRSYVRQLLRLSTAVILLTPYQIGEGSDYLAPAWAMAAMDTLFSGAAAFWRIGVPVLIILCMTIVLYYLLTAAYKILKKLLPHNIPNG